MNSKLVVGISSRALFDLNQSHQIFEKEGIEAYREYQIENEDKILDPGEAFNLVTKILKINNYMISKTELKLYYYLAIQQIQAYVFLIQLKLIS